MITFSCRKSFLRIDYSDGTFDQTEKCTPELLQWVVQNKDAEDEKDFKKQFQEKIGVKPFDEDATDYRSDIIKHSKIMVVKGLSCYIPEISELTIPEDFALKLLEAEKRNDEKEIQKFKNFWTLVSLNPDARVRDNIFWFLRKWDMKISQAGFIIAYRNVSLLKEEEYSQTDVKNILNNYYKCIYIDNINPAKNTYTLSNGIEVNIKDAYNSIINGDASPVFTDNYTHTFTIKLGQPVSMPREQCDSEQEHSCSRGLHIGATAWLAKNYCGEVGLQVLVNPADVVAVPRYDSYGKMRTCKYLPVAIIDFDESNRVKEPVINMHSDINYLKSIQEDLYNGNINNEDVNHYQLNNNRRLPRELVYQNILNRLSE